MTNLAVCPHCQRRVDPATHFYSVSGKPRCDRPFARVWTLAKRFALMQGIERGWTDERIGVELGVTKDAVQVARKRYRIPSRAAMDRSARGVAKRLGVPCEKTVIRWIERGWLHGRRAEARCGSRRCWWVEDGALMRFLGAPDYFHLWRAERITDPYLRRWAMKERGDVRFLTLSEVAARCFTQPNNVNAWIRKGFLPAVRMGVTTGNHLVKESDLTSFELPRIGPRPKPRKDQAA